MDHLLLDQQHPEDLGYPEDLADLDCLEDPEDLVNPVNLVDLGCLEDLDYPDYLGCPGYLGYPEDLADLEHLVKQHSKLYLSLINHQSDHRRE